MLIQFDDLKSRFSKESILAQVSEEAIYKRFCKEFPSKSMHSPWRKDKTPSFGFFKNRSNRWMWKDLGNGEGGDVFDFVMKDQKVDFTQALELIASSFFITDTNYNPIVVRDKFSASDAAQANRHKRTLIQVLRREITDEEYDWWNRILLTPEMLEAYLIRGAKEVWVDKKLYWFHKADNPIYYFLSQISGNVKCYRPLEKNKKRKWLSNQDPLRDIQGYYQCDIKNNPGQPLLLVKSLKEAAFFRVFGFNAMANTGEHVKFNEDFIRHIRKYCSPIIYLGDNDWPGRRAAIRIEQQWNIPIQIIPVNWGAKDPTDLWLKDYRKVYDLLNLIYDYIESIRSAGTSIESARRFRRTRKET